LAGDGVLDPACCFQRGQQSRPILDILFAEHPSLNLSRRTFFSASPWSFISLPAILVIFTLLSLKSINDLLCFNVPTCFPNSSQDAREDQDAFREIPFGLSE